MNTIRIADFSEFPAGRVPKDGPFNGTRFRDDYLAPALIEAIRQHGTLTVELDDVESFGSSFLEEAFGGLFRQDKFNPREVLRTLKINAHRPIYRTYKRQIEKYLKEAAAVRR